MNRKIIIEYNWSRNDETEIPTEHEAALDETAERQISAMLQEGNTSGELFDNIRMLDNDPEDGIGYSGYWSATRQILKA